MASAADPWSDQAYLRGEQYRTDGNLAARQSIYAFQQPRIDLAARVLDLAAPGPGAIIADVGCGNGAYLAELARRGLGWRVLGADLSVGMLAAARARISGTGGPGLVRSRRADEANPDGAGPVPGGAAAGAITLLAADAAALPFRDGAADLTLAMHMLYHVPDPRVAVRELRRVTRAGGRVVIGLNGVDHLRELRQVIAEVRGDGQSAPHERVSLPAGEALLRSSFSTVTRHDFVAELRVPGLGPIVDYVRSMSGTSYSADPERLVATAAARLPATPEGFYTITTHAGCLICEL